MLIDEFTFWRLWQFREERLEEELERRRILRERHDAEGQNAREVGIAPAGVEPWKAIVRLASRAADVGRRHHFGRGELLESGPGLTLGPCCEEVGG
ncbi:hypothetical protein [Sinomonas susongensis]|uniref:hypothetical protein n=1 Tax=Sinomonas susongensis TaxID=1324851 RepID=UPI0011080DD5|nr:hypothetical protein [Sinomonas susongensis]